MAAREFQFDVNHGEPPAICRHQDEFIFLEAEKHTVQHVAGFIGRDGIGSSPQTVSQIFLRNRDHLCVFKFRQRRKFFFGQPEDFEEALPAPDRGGVFSIDIDLDFAGGQFPDDVEETPRRERGRAFLFHLRFETAAHAYIEIGGGKMNFLLVSLQENVGKNRKGRARADHVLDLLQAFEQFFFRDAEFHDGRERA